MKVKIKDKIYNAEDQPIMVILTKGEVEQISEMPLKDENKYCIYPGEEYWTKNDYKNIKKWMSEE